MFHAQGDAASRRDIGKGIPAAGILVHPPHRAATACHIPLPVLWQFAHDQWFLLGVGGQHAYLVVTASNGVKHTVGPLPLSHQTSVETHPFGASQRRWFHVVGTFDERYAQALQPSVASAVLKRAGHERVRLGVHAVAQIGNAPVLHPFLYVRKIDVFGLAHSGHHTGASQFLQQGTVDTAVGAHPLQRGTYQRVAFLWDGCCRCLGHQLVAVQCTCGIPWVANAHPCGLACSGEGQQLGVVELQRVSL